MYQQVSVLKANILQRLSALFDKSREKAGVVES
jgi:hypothetical protein